MKTVILWTGVFMLALPGDSGAQTAPLEATPVSDAIGDSQSHPDVVADEAGRFLVVWESNLPGSGSFSVNARSFDRQGRARMGELSATPDFGGFQRPRTGWLGEGNSGGQRFVVVWEHNYSGGYGEYNRAEAAVLDVVPPAAGGSGPSTVELVAWFELGDLESDRPLAPAVAADPATGRFAAVWRAGADVRGRWYDRQGALIDDFDVEVRADAPGRPEVAVSPDGSSTFVVTYPGPDLDLPGRAVIRAQRFRAAADGAVTAEGEAFQVNVNDQGFLPGSAPAAYSDSGGPFVLWQRCQTSVPCEPCPAPAFTDCGIFGRFDPEVGVSPEFQVNSALQFDETSPDLTFDSAGDFAAVWQNRPAGGGDSTLSLQRLRPLAVPRLGPLFLDGQLLIVPVADPPGTDPERNLELPRVAALDDQRLVLVWSDEPTPVNPHDEPGDARVVFLIHEPAVATRCVPDGAALCLGGDRFRVTAGWTAPDGRTGAGRPAQMTADAGYFSFFDRSNVELVVEVQETRCGLDPCFLVSAGGMTDLGVELVVTDTLTGATATYSNPPGRLFEPIRDGDSFRGVESAAGTAVRPAVSLKAAAGGCGGAPEALCLRGQRFRVELDWTSPHGQGRGHGLGLSDGAGYFSFSPPTSVETFVKVLDACAINGHYWLFAAGLTDAGVEMRVTDTATGEESNYRNPQGIAFRPIVDLSAFGCAAAP